MEDSFKIDTKATVERPKSTKKFWFGVVAIVVAYTIVRTIGAYSDKLTNLGNETLINVAGAVFWAAILLFATGVGVLLSIRR